MPALTVVLIDAERANVRDMLPEMLNEDNEIDPFEVLMELVNVSRETRSVLDGVALDEVEGDMDREIEEDQA